MLRMIYDKAKFKFIDELNPKSVLVITASILIKASHPMHGSLVKFYFYQ